MKGSVGGPQNPDEAFVVEATGVLKVHIEDVRFGAATTRNGYFGFMLKPGKTPTGVVAYTYRVAMDVGGGNIRDVDVEVTSTSVASLNLHSSGGGGTVTATGNFSVRYLDAITDVDYTAFDFAGGSYQLNATDGGSATDKYQIALARPDGTAFHSSSSAQVVVAGGAITVRS